MNQRVDQLRSFIESRGQSWELVLNEYADDILRYSIGGNADELFSVLSANGLGLAESDLVQLQTEVLETEGDLDNNVFTFPLGGQYLFDPGEINGWGVLGVYDNSNTQDLGNIGATNLLRLSGGLTFPYDVRLKRFFAWHYNSNAAALPWGWVITKQEKINASNVVTTDYILDEVSDNGGVGPRDYGNTTNQLTDLDLSGIENSVIPAGETITLAVSSPTAVGTNYYSRILSGYFEFEILN